MTVRVLAAVIEDTGRFLDCQRPPHKRHGGLWEFPGGKLEVGETDFDAIRRELREELGVIAVSLGRELCAIHDPGSSYLIVFVEVTIEGTPACLEHTALRWCPATEFADLPLAPSDHRFVQTGVLAKRNSD
jgi:mutator protein MutT